MLVCVQCWVTQVISWQLSVSLPIYSSRMLQAWSRQSQSLFNQGETLYPLVEGEGSATWVDSSSVCCDGSSHTCTQNWEGKDFSSRLARAHLWNSPQGIFVQSTFPQSCMQLSQAHCKHFHALWTGFLYLHFFWWIQFQHIAQDCLCFWHMRCLLGPN